MPFTWSVLSQLTALSRSVLIRSFPPKTTQGSTNPKQSNNLSIERNLAAVEISFKPSAEHWAKIVQAFQKIKLASTMPYDSSPMTGERIREYWVINFAPVSVPGGTVSLAQVSTDQASDKSFEDVIRTASLALWVKWNNGVETPLDTSRDNGPGTISVSRDRIAFTLRPPETMLTIGNFEANPIITFRGWNYPIALPTEVRIRSLDRGVALDQTLHLNWKEEDASPSSTVTKPYISGPHSLDIALTPGSAAVSSNGDSRQTIDSCEYVSCGDLICHANPGYCLPCGPCGSVCCSGP
jgi:hypothetical protein